MKKTKLLIITAISMISALTSCEKNITTNDQSSISESSTACESITTTVQYYYEATYSAALTVKIEADVYFVENPVSKKIVHDYFNNDGAFGSEILKRHPTLEGLEYVVELNNDNNVINVFLCQPNTDPMTIACNGEHDKIDDWGFTSWNQVLNYYNISNNAN